MFPISFARKNKRTAEAPLLHKFKLSIHLSNKYTKSYVILTIYSRTSRNRTTMGTHIYLLVCKICKFSYRKTCFRKIFSFEINTCSKFAVIWILLTEKHIFRMTYIDVFYIILNKTPHKYLLLHSQCHKTLKIQQNT